MIVKTELADGTSEVFETSNYKISKVKDFHPLICKVTVYSNNGLKIKSAKRFFSFFYKRFTFKSEKVQKVLAEINQANNPEKVSEN